jgi:hypothetical protein
MSSYAVFVLQMVMTILVYSLISNWYLAPALAHLALPQILGYLLLPHTMRHIGLTSIVNAVVDPKVNPQWRNEVGYGDLLAAALAIVTILMLHFEVGGAIAMVWITNIVGLADWANAGIKATRFKVWDYQLGGFWFLPTFFVPSLVVTHVWMFYLLLTR